MNINDMPNQNKTVAVEAEQYVIGALLIDNNSIDRVGALVADHFYRAEHRAFFSEIVRQVTAGKTCDVLTVLEKVGDSVDDCLTYLNSIVQSTPSSANIAKHAATIVDRAVKRALIAIAGDIQDTTAASIEESAALVDRAAGRIEALGQQRTKQDPELMSDSLASYMDTLSDRMEGKIKPIATGFVDLDHRLDGGLERGTLTVIAGRPGTGKSAIGLCLCRNVAVWGSAAFLSMEMSKQQVNDRNIAALGHLPIAWLRKPPESDEQGWNKVTYAVHQSQELTFYIDDQTALTMLEIRAKARLVKRKGGLDLLVIDQLSFITGGGAKDAKSYEVIGEYTRGMLSLAKELDIAVVLLCQLNRKCEERPNKRPILSDLAISGSIEQDAANVIFLYRDEIYNPDSLEKGICEVNCAKQRQGEPGVVALTYVANQTRFEDMVRHWSPPLKKEPVKTRGFE